MTNNKVENGWRMPAEWEKHEGTWLQWSHDDQWPGYQMKLEHIWLHMVSFLHTHENVHICVQDERRRDHVVEQLQFFNIGLKNIDFHIIPTNDVWARDNGPTFIVNNGKLGMVNWIFNGWGGRYKHDLDNRVPLMINEKYRIPLFSPKLTVEGGNIEVNGRGTLMATKSAVLNDNRNPNMSLEEIEKIFRQYLGVSHFIWLTGLKTKNPLEIGWADDTDTHIDTVARFVNSDTVVYSWTDDKNDPCYPLLKRNYEELKEAITEQGKKLNLVPLPLPKDGVYSTSHIGAGGNIAELETPLRTDASYTNFYIANDVVLVPVYGNVNDQKALEILSEQFPHRDVIGINVVDLAENGGEIHCVTQQQPFAEK